MSCDPSPSLREKLTSAVAYVAQGRPKNHCDMSKTQCICKEYGYIFKQCKKNMSNYCKTPGHIIFESKEAAKS